MGGTGAPRRGKEEKGQGVLAHYAGLLLPPSHGPRVGAMSPAQLGFHSHSFFFFSISGTPGRGPDASFCLFHPLGSCCGGGLTLLVAFLGQVCSRCLSSPCLCPPLPFSLAQAHLLRQLGVSSSRDPSCIDFPWISMSTSKLGWHFASVPSLPSVFGYLTSLHGHLENPQEMLVEWDKCMG